MRLYLDDDSLDKVLIQLLQRAGHDVLVPSRFALAGAKDPEHLRRAIREQAHLLSHNYEDFELLHELLMDGGGHHPGILIVRKDNDPRRDLKPARVVQALRNLETAGIAIADQYIILNHWR